MNSRITDIIQKNGERLKSIKARFLSALNFISTQIKIVQALFELFFVKKIPLSRRMGYVMGGWISGSVVQWISGSVDQWISGSVDQWISERCLYVTPIRLDLLLETNQISCCKGKWYVRRFDPDTVENGHIYSSIKEKEVFRFWTHFDIFCGLG